MSKWIERPRSYYPDFDKALIVKTNDETTVQAVFADAATRAAFQQLEDFNLHVVHADEGSRLELEIEQGITDTVILQNLYTAFAVVLRKLAPSSNYYSA